MKNRMAFGLLGLLLIFLSAPLGRADERNQAMEITFNRPVNIPGHVLAPGTYRFELTETNDREVVRIFSADRSKVLATIQTIARQRPEPSDKPEVVVAQSESSGNAAILYWFYPGLTDGHEFVYSRQQRQQFAGAKQQIVAGD